MMPIFLAKIGEKVKVVGIAGGKGVYFRLINMGIKIGDVVEVIQNAGGPVIIKKGNVRLALGAGLSGKILVVPEKGGV